MVHQPPNCIDQTPTVHLPEIQCQGCRLATYFILSSYYRSNKKLISPLPLTRKPVECPSFANKPLVVWQSSPSHWTYRTLMVSESLVFFYSVLWYLFGQDPTGFAPRLPLRLLRQEQRSDEHESMAPRVPTDKWYWATARTQRQAAAETARQTDRRTATYLVFWRATVDTPWSSQPSSLPLYRLTAQTRNPLIPSTRY